MDCATLFATATVERRLDTKTKACPPSSRMSQMASTTTSRLFLVMDLDVPSSLKVI